METLKILQEQPTEDKPYYVEDYPYGFRLRTRMRYYVETTNRGQRFVSQTLNPKTDKWNNPKKSTYSQILLIGLNEKGHISYVSQSLAYSSKKEALNFGEKYKGFFSDYQLKEYKSILGMLEVYDKVEYTIRKRLYKNKETGDITSIVPVMNLNKYVEVDDDGNEIDKEKEGKEQIEQNILLNKTAIANATLKGVSFDDAYKTFKRAGK